jgi:hypothetical protein
VLVVIRKVRAIYLGSVRTPAVKERIVKVMDHLVGYFAGDGNAGNLPTSRASC